MILLFCLLLLAGGYSFAFYYTGLALWFYFLWVPLSLLLSFLSFCIFVILLFQFMKRTNPKGKFRHALLYQVCQMILFILNIKIKVVGKNFIPNETFVCYANHKSHIDPIALYVALHKICSAIGKKDLFKYPVIKQCQPVFGVIAIDRENDRAAAKSIIEAIRAIKEGMSYIIFPEGGIKTRQTEEMVDLRAGAYKLVKKSGARLLPATIIGSSRIKTRTSLLRRIQITIVFHESLDASAYEEKSTTDLGQMVMNYVHEDILKYENQNIS